MRSRLRLAVLAVLVVITGRPGGVEAMAPRVRVGLARGVPEVRFSGAEGVSVSPRRGGATLAWVEPGRVWRLRPSAAAVELSGEEGEGPWRTEDGVVLSPPEGGAITIYGLSGHWDGVADRRYRGIVEVFGHGAGGLTVVNVLDLEAYLRGVVPSEMPAGYPEEALKAQAVAARGQALMKAGRHRQEGFDLCVGEHCQVYGGATSESERSDRAVAMTRGEVLLWARRLADTLYSSNCGGHTTNNEDYWLGQPPVPYLRGQPDFEPGGQVQHQFPLPQAELERFLKYAPALNCNQPQYAQAQTIRWWLLASRAELEEKMPRELGDFGELLGLRIAERADCGTVQTLYIVGSRRLVRVRGGAAIRRALGGLNSARFALEPVLGEDGLPVAFITWGAGWGHQVGMCQVGAAGLAERGWDYRRILLKYYPGCRLARRY